MGGMTSEHELKHLLKSNERPRGLSDSEETRLRHRLGLGLDLDVELGSSVDTARRSNTNVRVRAVLLSAAALLVIIGMASLTRRQGSTLDTARSGDAPPALAVFCAGELDRAVAAVEEWNGVDAWAWSTVGTDPDVGALTLAALVELDRTREDPSTVSSGLRRRLEEELSSQTRPVGGGPAYAARSNAVLDSLRYLRHRLGELDSEGLCDLERLTAAIELSG